MKKNILLFILFIGPTLFTHGTYANEGLDLDLVILKINKEVKSLNKEILSLKDENELIKESQRINSEKIAELFEVIKLNSSKKETVVKTIKTDNEKIALSLFSSGKENFVQGEYEKAVFLFKNYLNKYPGFPNTENAKLWLARSYFQIEEYSSSKSSYIDFQSINNHPKYPDSIFELAKVLIKLDEVNEAKLLLIDMIKQYPSHSLINKANKLLLDL